MMNNVARDFDYYESSLLLKTARDFYWVIFNNTP